jgi:hypothetical protein
VRIYEGAPRQNYEDILRSVGAILDQRGMREVTVAETDDGFMVQGLAVEPGEDKSWGDPSARQTKETFYLRDDDIARLMDEAVARRQGRAPQPPSEAQRQATQFYEPALRVIGAYIDQQQPRDIFFFEQERQFVMRLLTQTRVGLRHVLVEFTREEVEAMIAGGQRARPPGS